MAQMALPFSQLSFPSPISNHPNRTFHFNPKPTASLGRTHKLPSKSLNLSTIAKASEEAENQNAATSDEAAANPPAEGKPQLDEKTDLGSEIKRLMKERDEQKESSFFDGVSEEIKEIEWPGFGKVLSTTGVVLGVIAGSSVVLLTVNAVLAELSDRFFAGKGVQDFFG